MVTKFELIMFAKDEILSFLYSKTLTMHLIL